MVLKLLVLVVQPCNSPLKCPDLAAGLIPFPLSLLAFPLPCSLLPGVHPTIHLLEVEPDAKLIQVLLSVLEKILDVAEVVEEVGVLISRRHPALVVTATNKTEWEVLKAVRIVMGETGHSELHNTQQPILPRPSSHLKDTVVADGGNLTTPQSALDSPTPLRVFRNVLAVTP